MKDEKDSLARCHVELLERVWILCDDDGGGGTQAGLGRLQVDSELQLDSEDSEADLSETVRTTTNHAVMMAARARDRESCHGQVTRLGS
jgi:hypothetical protein